jgi:FAD/FMN-containing dehydrogenase
MNARLADIPGVLAALARTTDPATVVRDPAELAFHALDVYGEGAPLAAVLRPADVDTLVRCVREVTAAGIALVARGGGLSYTDGYLAARPQSVLVDTTRLDRIVEINAGDRYVVVEAGVTWAALDAALAPHGLRTPYWGPLSGLRATVGGALSQGSVFLGSGLHGSVGDSVLGMEIVTADGSLLRTGSAASGNSAPFTRWFGPDPTGLFVGDAGCLGIKARASLRLLPRPAALDYLSFEYDDAATMLAAMAEVSRQNLASECFGFDPVLAQMRMKRASLASDAKTLGQVVRKAGLVEGLKLVAAGRSFLDPSKFSAHVVIEGDSGAAVAARLAAARRALGAGGREVDNSIPKVLRSQPFTPPNNMLGPAGERWVPVHGIVPHSQAQATHAAVEALFARERDTLRAHRIEVSYLFTTVAQQGTLIEPVFYWPDAHTAYHRRMVEAEHLRRCGEPAADPAARAVVARLKAEVAGVLRAHGATHFQLGKFYAWRAGRDPAALALFDAVKAHLDPRGLMNPGALR